MPHVAVMTDAASQADLAQPDGMDPPFISAARKGKRKGRVKRQEQNEPGSDVKVEDKTRRTTNKRTAKPQNRPQGIIIAKKPDGLTYAVIKKLTEELDSQDIGVTIKSTRQTAAGELLLSVGKGFSAAAAGMLLKGQLVTKWRLSGTRHPPS